MKLIYIVNKYVIDARKMTVSQLSLHGNMDSYVNCAVAYSVKVFTSLHLFFLSLVVICW